MFEYTLTIVLTAVLCLVGAKRKSKIPVVLITILWSVLFAFRYGVGTDFGTYYRMYQRIGRMDLETHLLTQRDSLFGLVTYLCHRASNGSWTFYQFVIALLIYVPVLSTFRSESKDMLVPCLVYIFSLSMFSGYNGMRQAIAVSLVFFAYYRFYLKDKRILYYLSLALAFGFHSSVILSLPFFYFSKKKYRMRNVILISLAFLVAYLLIWQLWPLMISFLRAIGQTKMAEDYAEVAQDKGSGMLRMLVIAVPLLIAIPGRKRLAKLCPTADNEIMMTLFATLFMMLSTRYWIFARVSAYFGLTRMLLMSRLKQVFAPGGSRGVFVMLMLVLYYIYMVMMLLHGEGHYYPYAAMPIGW